MHRKATHVNNFKAARQHPLTYPGERPDFSYLLINRRVCPITVPKGNLEKAIVHLSRKRHIPLKKALEDLGVAPLEERFAMMGYGSNRNPATLHFKFENYNQEGNVSNVIPVIKGSIRGVDAVAATFYGQGFIYADLWPDPRAANTEIESWLTLFDLDQLRSMNAAEHIDDPEVYAVGTFDGFRIAGSSKTFETMCYVGKSPIFVLPYGQDMPYAFKDIKAKNRILHTVRQRELLAIVLSHSDLKDDIVEQLHLAEQDPDLIMSPYPYEKKRDFRDPFQIADAVATYLNHVWWVYGGEQTRLPVWHHKISTKIKEWIMHTSLEESTMEVKKRRDELLSLVEANNPDEKKTLGYLLNH
jgi:hypothetical protein